MRDLTTEQLKALEQRLRPGGMSTSGFLAPAQSLRTVVEQDRLVLNELGLTFAQVADRLEAVFGRAERRLQLAFRKGHDVLRSEDGTDIIQVESELQVRAWHFNGYQDCPFHDDEGRPCPTQPWASADYELTHTGRGEKMMVPGLLVHLVRAHSFFEGDVPYRVDPRQLAQILTLKPGLHTVPEWRTERVWAMLEASGGLPWFGIGGPRWYWRPSLMELLEMGAAGRPRCWDERVELAHSITACRAGDWCVLVVRRSGLLGDTARLDGSELAVPRKAGRGTYQFRRVERRYVALEDE